MSEQRLLVVDDEAGMLEVCADTLAAIPDLEVVLEQNSVKAAERLENEYWDVLVTDLRMPEIDGVELLRIAYEHHPHLDALVLTAYPSVDSAVESLKLGAADYLTKPFLPDEFRSTVRRILDNRELRWENKLLRRQIERPYSFGGIIGVSPAMKSVFDTVARVAESDVDVLIEGETGTGKELVARNIHERSDRSESPFVPVDCGAIPEALLESEFFGHEKGSFTGAHEQSLGLMEYASGGILFLDEIGELPLNLQAKLLRALQERRIRRIGGSRETPIDLRVVAATSRSLDEETKSGRFRSDLYYRINVVRIELPPLGTRPEDIEPLFNHFLGLYSEEMGRNPVSFDPLALEVLTGYSWPGNVRELQNLVKRLLALRAGDTITVDDLPDQIVANSRGGADGTGQGFFELRDARIAAFELTYLRDLLEEYSGDVSAAASEAGLPRGTLYRLSKKHGLTPADYRE